MFEYMFSNNLKVITLSNDPSINGTNFLLLGDSITNRANNLIKFATTNNKYRFALINPAKHHNNEVMKILINKINMNRGVVTFSENYSEDISDSDSESDNEFEKNCEYYAEDPP